MSEELTQINPSDESAESMEQRRETFMSSGAESEAEHAAEQQRNAELLEAGIEIDEAGQVVDDSQGFLPDNPIQLAQEAGTAVVGGLADAVESVGGFLELGGDTIKTWANHVYGDPYSTEDDIDPTQNPFSDQYVSGDANWLDIPDNWVPENKSGLGMLARGLAEFGFLTAATGGVGGYTSGAARVGTRLAAAGRAAGIGSKGSRLIKVFHKGAVIGAEGGIADLISNSSETANIANLINEHAPGIPFMEALAVDPEKDSAWIARLKTVLAGAGINHVGHFLAGFIKASWRGAKALRKGASVDEANRIVNQTLDSEMGRANYLDEAAATERAADNWNQGRGISNVPNREMYLDQYLDETELARLRDPLTSQLELDQLDEIADQRGLAEGNPWSWEDMQSAQQFEEGLTRKPDSAVNPNLFSDADKSTYRPDSPNPVLQSMKESIQDMKAGGEGRSYEPLQTEAALNNMARGDTSVRQAIVEMSKTIAREAFSELDSSLNFKEVQALIIKQAEEIYGLLEDGGEQAVKNLKAHFKNKENGIEWTHDGNTIVTGNAAQKMALQLVIHSLTKQSQAIASGANKVANSASLIRQGEQIHNALRVALIEHKKIGFMTGTELAVQKVVKLSKQRRLEIEEGLADIEIKTNNFFDELDRLFKEGSHKDRRALMELYELSGGKVNTIEQITDYLRANLIGGRMNGENIPARWKTEARSVFYNSILSSLKTPVKAIAGTNMIALLRPFQAYLGAGLKGDKKEMFLAAAQIDAIGKAWAEGFEMFKHNWELGLNRQTQSYVGRFDFEKDIQTWKSLQPYYEAYGTSLEQTAYNKLDSLVDLNNNPWMRYSANAMGAGDALARTIIGRMEMRMQAARAAMESGIDMNDVVAWANKNEELFRSNVFKQNEHGRWIVSKKSASLAGDEAAMTKALEGNLAGLERIARITGMRAFFPFVRTGYNSLRLAFGHTELNRFTAQYHDIINGENLAKYGIANADELASAQALMRGRMAMGNAIIGMGTIAAATGLMTGSLPKDKETRDLWKLNGIKPNSFKFGDVYVSYDDIEPFNTIFTTTANVIAHSHVLGTDLRDEMLEKLVFMTTAVIVDKSMLAGVEDLAGVLSADTAGGKLKRTGAKFIRSHLPYAGLLAQLGGIMDANEKEANTFLEQIFQRDAIFKSIFYNNKYDIHAKDRSGKPLSKSSGIPLLDAFNAESPVAVTLAGNDPIKLGLYRMSYNLPEVMTRYKGETLNSYERSRLQYYMSTGNLRKRLARIMRPGGVWDRDLTRFESEGFRQRDGFELRKQRFYRLVHEIHLDEQRIAMVKLKRDNPNLARRIELRALKGRVGKSGRYDRLEHLLETFPK